MNNFSRNNRSGGGNFRRREFDPNRSERQMYQAVCSNCGKDCQVPFQPTGSKPVYCSNCFEANNGGPSSRFEGRDSQRSFDRGPRNFENRSPDRDRNASSQSTQQLTAINDKLDRILRMLSPKPSFSTDQAPVESVPAPKKVKSSKTAKKVTSKKKKS